MEGVKLDVICYFCLESMLVDKDAEKEDSLEDRQIELSVNCTLPCGHSVHRACISAWVKKEASRKQIGTCPVCNKKFHLRNDLRPLYLNVQEEEDDLAVKVKKEYEAEVKNMKMEMEALKQENLELKLATNTAKETDIDFEMATAQEVDHLTELLNKCDIS